MTDETPNPADAESTTDGGLDALLASLASLATVTTPQPSPELLALLGGRRGAPPRRLHARALGVAAVAGVMLIGASGVAAATDRLPSPLEKIVTRFDDPKGSTTVPVPAGSTTHNPTSTSVPAGPTATVAAPSHNADPDPGVSHEPDPSRSRETDGRTQAPQPTTSGREGDWGGGHASPTAPSGDPGEARDPLRPSAVASPSATVQPDGRDSATPSPSGSHQGD